ncbi:M3 family metallopeptidase [Pantoea ananatis]|uniref:M3 family metallopeptidase n=1 Tax=Pantoea ananas TaxID=553 RepID=UPI0022204593|nr:M3 family metallopeptidase [Pantoea ananatis]
MHVLAVGGDHDMLAQEIADACGRQAPARGHPAGADRAHGYRRVFVPAVLGIHLGAGRLAGLGDAGHHLARPRACAGRGGGRRRGRPLALRGEQVLDFLHDLAARAKPYAQRDRAELEAFAREHLGLDTLEAWDLAYAGEKLKQARYSFSEQEVKRYFTEPKVLEGLFGLIHDLYGLRVEADSAPVWHPDVRFFRLSDAQGRLVGQFYLDLYARRQARRRLDGRLPAAAARAEAGIGDWGFGMVAIALWEGLQPRRAFPGKPVGAEAPPTKRRRPSRKARDTLSRSLPRHDVMPIPVMTTRRIRTPPST